MMSFKHLKNFTATLDEVSEVKLFKSEQQSKTTAIESKFKIISYINFYRPKQTFPQHKLMPQIQAFKSQRTIPHIVFHI